MAVNSQILEIDKTVYLINKIFINFCNLLKLKFTKLLEAFNCSICLGELKNTFITTKCAHRFCEECIKQSITEFSKCKFN